MWRTFGFAVVMAAFGLASADVSCHCLNGTKLGSCPAFNKCTEVDIYGCPRGCQVTAEATIGFFVLAMTVALAGVLIWARCTHHMCWYKAPDFSHEIPEELRELHEEYKEQEAKRRSTRMKSKNRVEVTLEKNPFVGEKPASPFESELDPFSQNGPLPEALEESDDPFVAEVPLPTVVIQSSEDKDSVV